MQDARLGGSTLVKSSRTFPKLGGSLGYGAGALSQEGMEATEMHQYLRLAYLVDWPIKGLRNKKRAP